MKTRLIELKKTDTVDYRKGLKDILEAPLDPKVGLTVPEIKTRMELLDLLDSGGELLLTEEQFAVLRNVVNLNHYPKATREIWQFIQDITNAPEVESELRAVK